MTNVERREALQFPKMPQPDSRNSLVEMKLKRGQVFEVPELLQTVIRDAGGSEGELFQILERPQHVQIIVADPAERELNRGDSPFR